MEAERKDDFSAAITVKLGFHTPNKERRTRHWYSYVTTGDISLGKVTLKSSFVENTPLILLQKLGDST